MCNMFKANASHVWNIKSDWLISILHLHISKPLIVGSKRGALNFIDIGNVQGYMFSDMYWQVR